jgi:hypothetical protein
MVVGIYGCRKKNLWLWEQKHRMWEQKPMDVGTKTYFLVTKHMIVGTITYGCENKSMV